MEDTLSHTFALQIVNDATQDLISHNAEHLIRYIYSNREKSPYTDRIVRVGLALKTLLKSNDVTPCVSAATMLPAIEDLHCMMAETKDKVHKTVLAQELQFMQSCTLLDDLISLNTGS